MEFDDYKLAPDDYQEMAKAYFSTLAENDFRFVKINTDKKQKQEILDKISNNICKLNIYIDYLKKTSKAQKHSQSISKICGNLQLCKNLFDWYPSLYESNLTQSYYTFLFSQVFNLPVNWHKAVLY